MVYYFDVLCKSAKCDFNKREYCYLLSNPQSNRLYCMNKTKLQKKKSVIPCLNAEQCSFAHTQGPRQGEMSLRMKNRIGLRCKTANQSSTLT